MSSPSAPTGIERFPNPARMSDAGFCRSMLPLVSRTFTLNIRVLPQRLRDPVLIAYLFCRMADTVEDAPGFPEERRAGHLRLFGDLFGCREAGEEGVVEFAAPFRADGATDDPAWHLCRHALPVFRAFSRLPRGQQEPIEACVREMTAGMARYLPSQGRAGADSQTPRPATGLRAQGWSALPTVDDLLGYCYVVAGTVGIMLCRLFGENSPAIGPEVLGKLESHAVSFGNALQLTNIIKDANRDRLRSRSFIPEELTAKHGIGTRDLWNPSLEDRSHRVLVDMVGLALEHCDHAFHYSVLLPRRELRLRLFCLWPLFLALRTLGTVLVLKNPFLGSSPIKIPRSEVYRTLHATSLASPSNHLLERLYRSRKKSLVAALTS